MSESRTGTNTHPAYPNWGTKHQPAMTIGASGAGLGLGATRGRGMSLAGGGVGGKGKYNWHTVVDGLSE